MYGREIFFSLLRTNLPNSQTQNVVVAKLATVLQNVMVTERSRSPPHSANHDIFSDISDDDDDVPVQKLENDPPGELPTSMRPYLAMIRSGIMRRPMR